MSQPEIHDLGMLDTDYAQLLAAGHEEVGSRKSEVGSVPTAKAVGLR